MREKHLLNDNYIKMEKIKRIPIEVSARHIHLSHKDMEKLFGKSHELKKLKELTQPKEFSCHETLEVRVGARRISNVRVVGPCREKTQVEISLTDALLLRISPPLRVSEETAGSLGAVLRGPKGEFQINEGVIVPLRHIHCSPKEAKKLGIKNGDKVSVEIEGERGLVFDNVAVRSSKDYKLSMHLDTDEGNAAGINKRGEGIIANN